MTSTSVLLVLASCVDSGPPQRLVHELTASGLQSTIVAEYSAATWRRLMARGWAARLRARIGATVMFPVRAVLHVWRARPRWVIATTNPFILPMVLVATRPLHGARVVALVYDLVPDALQVTGRLAPSNPGYRLAAWVTRFWVRHADGVVFLGKRMAEYTETTYGAARRSAIIGVGADPREFDAMALGDPAPCSDVERWCEGRTIVSYVGNLGLSHDWNTVADAVPRALRGSEIRCVICASGPGADVLRHAWRDLVPDYVRFEPPLPDNAWARLMRRSAISLVTVRDQATQIPIGFPSKLYSAMAAGNAIVAVAPRGSDLADTIERHDCGVVVAPGDVEALEAALERLASDPAALERLQMNARRAVDEYYDIRSVARQWCDFLAATMTERPATRRYDIGKRAIDVVASASALVVLSPLLALLALAIRVTMGSPVLFRQERGGVNGMPFALLKFRTMRQPHPGEESPAHDAARLTKLGRWLRAMSLDELPALWNVLRGEMSLVGPRPLPLRYLGRYSPEQARRHEVRPGITGWAQINGRNAIGWDERFVLDVQYVERRSLRWDLDILARTVWKVLRAEGISQPGHATMSEFLGSPSEHKHEA